MTNTKAQYYYQRAEQYERLSELLVSDDAKRRVRQMAARCRELAQQAEAAFQ